MNDTRTTATILVINRVVLVFGYQINSNFRQFRLIMMEMIMKSLVLLSSLVLGACASTSGAPLQNCDALLQSFIPVQCQEVTGGLLCVNENQKYLSVLSGEKNIKFHHTKAKEAGYVKKPVSTQCSVPGVGEFEASYWERDKMASAPRLNYKTL